MQDWQLTTTEERLTLRRQWPKYWHYAWGLGRLTLVGGLIFFIMLDYLRRQGSAPASWFDWLCLTGSGGLTTGWPAC